MQNLQYLLESGQDADVSVAAADGGIAAHSSVLAARSRVFASMLHQDPRVVDVSDMPMDVVRRLLTFVYTAEAPQLRGVAPQLLVLADRFELPALKEMCELRMVEDLCVENTVPYCVLALRHKCELLRNAAVDYFAQHALQVLGSQGWMQQLRKDPKPLVEISRMVGSHAIMAASIDELQTLLAGGIRMD